MIVQLSLSFFGQGAVMGRSRDEVRALLKAGYDVTVITDLGNLTYLNSLKEFKHKLQIIPIKLFYIHSPFRKVSSELVFAIQSYRALKALKKNVSIDLIICHTVTNSYAAAYFGKKNNIPTLLILHELIRDRIIYGNPYNWWTTKLYKHATRYALKAINYFVGVSSYMKKFIVLEGATNKKTFVNHNPVDLEKFYPMKDTTKNIDILFIGRLSVEKGVGILIKSTKFFDKNWIVTIIGDGALRKDLEQLAYEYNYNVKFEGWIKYENLNPFINRAKILVVPSVTEPHGIVVLEAMACGVPVIGSKTGGIPDMIKHNVNGWLVIKNDPKALGRQINKVLDNEMVLQKMGKEALKTAEMFSRKNFEKKISRFYKALIKNKIF